MTELLLLVGVAVLVAANGFFVAAEFALVRARDQKIDQMVEDGLRGAALARVQVDRIDEYLSACQLGITMASIGIGFLGEPAIASLLEEPLGNVMSHGIAVVIAFTISYLIVTAAHITVGEQVPKIYAITHPELIARRASRLLGAFRTVFKPLIWALNTASNAMLRWVGVDAKADFEDDLSNAEDLKLLIVRSATGGKIDPGEAGMLSGVFHLHEQEARQVMTPIPAVVTVDISETAEQALRRCVDSGHTRLVVTEDGNTDRVRGIVHNNSLARRVLNEGPDASIEDIVEEVVGEIADETDPAVAGIRQLANGDWWVRGHVPITDLADYGLELPVDSDAYNSVGGFVFGELGRLPKRGDMVRANGYSLRVESVRENRIDAVRIRDHSSEAPGEVSLAQEPRESTEGA